jgi:hypothetical protein
MADLHLDFHGVRVAVTGAPPELEHALRVDFSWFVQHGRSDPPNVGLRVTAGEPPWQTLPAARNVLVDPMRAAYDDATGIRWVDYGGRALVRWDPASETGQAWGADAAQLHEIVYLLIQSRVGELLDRRGLHRVHALGLARAGRGVVCLLPSGGGKTTLGLAALALPGVRLLSDDTPLVTRGGQLLPFPVRVGTMDDPPAGLPDAHLHRFDRHAKPTKWLIDVAAFGDRIAEACAPAAILLGERQLAGAASIAPMARAQAAPELGRSCVVGLGLPQLVEYFLRVSARDVADKAGLVASRSVAAAALLARARCYRFRLARDRGENTRALGEFLARLD